MWACGYFGWNCWTKQNKKTLLRNGTAIKREEKRRFALVERFKNPYVHWTTTSEILSFVRSFVQWNSIWVAYISLWSHHLSSEKRNYIPYQCYRSDESFSLVSFKSVKTPRATQCLRVNTIFTTQMPFDSLFSWSLTVFSDKSQQFELFWFDPMECSTFHIIRSSRSHDSTRFVWIAFIFFNIMNTHSRNECDWL